MSADPKKRRRMSAFVAPPASKTKPALNRRASTSALPDSLSAVGSLMSLQSSWKNSFVEELHRARCEDLSIKDPDAEKMFTRFVKAMEAPWNRKILHLANMNLGEKSFQVLRRQLSTNNHFQSLVLSNNKLDDRCASLLSDIITENITISNLDLRGCSLGQGSIALIAPALPQSGITCLDLSTVTGHRPSDLGKEGAAKLARAMVSSHKTLSELRLSGIVGCFHLLQCLLEAAEQEKTSMGPTSPSSARFRGLKLLDIRRNDIGVNVEGLDSEQVIRDLARCVVNPFICPLHLNLSGNSLGADFCRILKNLLHRERTPIKTLILDDNPLGDQGIAHLCNGLRRIEEVTLLHHSTRWRPQPHVLWSHTYVQILQEKRASLVTLSLSSTQLGSNSMKAVGSYVASSLSLAKLNLRHNALYSSGVQILCEGLEANKSITCLDITNVKVDDNAVDSIRGLISHRTLQELCLDKNNLKDKTIAAISEELSLSCTPGGQDSSMQSSEPLQSHIHKLSVAGNPVDFGLVVQLNDLLEANRNILKRRTKVYVRDRRHSLTVDNHLKNAQASLKQFTQKLESTKDTYEATVRSENKETAQLGEPLNNNTFRNQVHEIASDMRELDAQREEVVSIKTAEIRAMHAKVRKVQIETTKLQKQRKIVDESMESVTRGEMAKEIYGLEKQLDAESRARRLAKDSLGAYLQKLKELHDTMMQSYKEKYPDQQIEEQKVILPSLPSRICQRSHRSVENFAKFYSSFLRLHTHSPTFSNLDRGR